MEANRLYDIIVHIAHSMNLDDSETKKILETCDIKNIIIPKDIIMMIDEIIESNKNEILHYESKFKSVNMKRKFNELKYKLCKLQIYALIKRMKETKIDNIDKINDFIIKLKNNIKISTDILQAGGSYKFDKKYNNYLRFILKYVN